METKVALQSINPANGKIIKNYDEIDRDELENLLKKVDETQQEWVHVPFSERSEKMKKAAKILRDKAGEFGQLMADEMGKPVSQGKAEAEKCAWVCDYYAENAEDILKDVPVETDASNSYVHYQPMGIVMAIMPWNYPFWQVFRFAAPALMAGNAGVLKHSENVTGCALAIEKIFQDAGFPENLFRTLLINRDKAKDVIENPRVKAVTLTGSTRAGKIVASQAGAALKKTVLELGGSDPYVVLEDADLDAAIKTCVTSRLLNSGQSCIAAKRFVVVEKVYDEFVKKLVESMKSKKMGDPNDDVDLGPQAREDLRDNLHDQVTRSVEKGAKVLTGGEIPDMEGFYYPPTVLVNVSSGMSAYKEELFGPVATVIKAKDEDDAIRIANDTNFGLGSAVFTENIEKGEQIAREKLHAGSSFVNTFVKSDPRLPFGGIKNSGYGRELSPFGIKEFMNIKTVYVA
ncbi:MAG TPA: NAD-dependent succinate-semialdehyde dehydrogenase [Balneolales bacterium]|nr:NAD-dependent succinate-semialdehyde dehydrogenase [Balneolales bacterium]